MAYKLTAMNREEFEKHQRMDYFYSTSFENYEDYIASIERINKRNEEWEKESCRRYKLFEHEHELNSHWFGKNTALCECSMRSIMAAYEDSREVW